MESKKMGAFGAHGVEFLKGLVLHTIRKMHLLDHGVVSGSVIQHLIFLADYAHYKTNGYGITGITYRLTYFGPYADIIDAVLRILEARGYIEVHVSVDDGKVYKLSAKGWAVTYPDTTDNEILMRTVRLYDTIEKYHDKDAEELREIATNYVPEHVKLGDTFTFGESEIHGMKQYIGRIVVEKGDDGYVAWIDTYPGCIGIGDTEIEEALRNLGEAMHLYFETLLEESDKD